MPIETPFTVRKESVAMERILADVRIILWLATTVITVAYQTEVGHGEIWLTIILSIFLVYALGMWIIARNSPRYVRHAALVSSFIEVELITLLIWTSSSYSYAQLTPFYLWYVFYVVSISLRYGMQISILGLAASVVMYTAISISPRNPVMLIPNFLGYTGFLFILAFLFGHMSERQRSYQTRIVVVNELGVALVSLSTSKEIIRLLVSQTSKLVGAAICWFLPCSDGKTMDAPFISPGVTNNKIIAFMDNLDDWAPANILEQGHIMVTNRPRRDLHITTDALKILPLRSFAAVPLYVRDTPVGVLYVVDKLPRGFSGYDIELLELIGAQAAPIIENIQLWERLKDAAASEERLRIARDLHDNFLQTLSAIKLYLERCRLQIDKDPTKAKASVERLHEISTQGLADVRSYLSQLRLMGPEPSRFGQAAERSAMEVASRAGFTVHTDIDVTENVITRQLSLAAFQILRELLNNAAKHSEATNVWVKVKSVSDKLEIEIRDDGLGFDLEEAKRASEKGHLGLLGVEERVRELKGELRLESHLGQGTRAFVVLPIHSEE
jgi:signal transduction histidine kinase